LADEPPCSPILLKRLIGRWLITES
jgi:hypothetical protein